MKIKNRILAALAIGCLSLPFASCSEEGILVNSNDKAYIVFDKNFTKDTTTVSFRMYKDGENAKIAIPVSAFGEVQTEDLHFRVAVDESRTTLASNLYKLPEDCVIKHDQEENEIYVELIKSPEMATKTFLLALQVVEEGKVKQGTREYSRALINVTDRLFQPDWWTINDLGSEDNPRNSVTSYYLGVYTEDKYVMFLEELKKDNMVFDGKNKQVLRKYAIKLKNTIKNINAEREAQGLGPLTDSKTGIEIEVPIAG